MALSMDDIHFELVKACQGGDLNQFYQLTYYNKTTERLIKGDVNHIHKTKYGKYKPGDYLYISCEYGHEELIEPLIKFGADVERTFNKSLTPLLVGCQKGHLEVVKVLASVGCVIHSQEKEFKETPIYNACIYGQLNIIEFILNENPNILRETVNGSIGTAVKFEYVHVWSDLTKLTKTGELFIGNYLLFLACIKGHIGIVKYLVDKGMDINSISPAKNFYSAVQSPLSVACRENDFELASYLIHQKAEITVSIVDQYMDFVGKILANKITDFRRSSSLTLNADVEKSNGEKKLSIYWDTLNLYKVGRFWFEDYGSQVHLMDLHSNHLTSLPDDFFLSLPNLIDLDVSSNKLTQLPTKGLKESRIQRVILSSNHLEELPLDLFINLSLENLDVSKNKISCLPEEVVSENGSIQKWECPSLKFFKCSFNKIANIPRAIEGATGLEKLFCSNNQLSVFSVTWRCPLIELDLSHNEISEFTAICQMVWSKTLQRLVLAYNKIISLSSNICHLLNIQTIDLSHNEIVALPPPSAWKCKVLNKLNLSHNKLSANTGVLDFINVDKKRHSAVSMLNDNAPHCITSCEFPVALFSDCLHILDISHNILETIPESLCNLIGLTELDLSHNPNLHELPAELGNLKNVWNLHLTNLALNNVPFKMDDRNHAKTVLPYLRRKLRQSVPFNRIKLMVVGLQGRGKTTLIATLQGKQPPPDISTVGVVVQDWCLSPPNHRNLTSILSWSSSTEQKDDITLSCWDLAGQHVYYATHQCFLTGGTLYLAVFNTTHGNDGIDSLAPWLLNIQARAPNSQVIVVGTYIDKLPKNKKRSFLDGMERDIRVKYNRKGFPILSGTVFVSCVTGEGLTTLRDKIYNVAKSMNEKGTNEGKEAPLSYIQLYDSIIKEAELRKEKNEPPIMTTFELLALAETNKDNDIFDIQELSQAASFLHEHGILLHFNDQLRELNTLFFIDPPWLCDMLALVVAVREKNPFVIDGYIEKEKLLLILKNPRLPEQFIPQYLQLLERFEIVLTLNNQKFLIPSMLPKERPQNLKAKLEEKSSFTTNDKHLNNTIIRNYHMDYTPSGFWSRLIARLSIAIHRWGVVVSDMSIDDENQTDSIEGTEKYSLSLWREGMFVIYEDGYFLIESFDDEELFEGCSNRGVHILVWSSIGDFSVMSFIVDHLDTLIQEWYPGLIDCFATGDTLIQKFIPCPICIEKQIEKENFDSNLKEFFSVMSRNQRLVHQFDLRICAFAALNYKAISCDQHTSSPVSLKQLVPELLLTDLPDCFTIENEYFDFEPNENTRLGVGGAGGVYRGIYKNQNVAVKQFHSSKRGKGNSLFSTDSKDYIDSVSSNDEVFVPDEQALESMEDGTVIQAFWDLRQEVAVLCRLQHQNIVGFIGVCLSPLCFALELAPLGSLQGILEKLCDAREEKYKSIPVSHLSLPCILDRHVTCQIALQVARAITYLHENEIIYRDLKSDNILVYSMGSDQPVLVKISDYGISTFATPQGVLGEAGTPGFQAPEVKIASAYDEKVDIFSFGIWLYELITGYRPFRHYRTGTEIKRAVARGIRPSFEKDGIKPRLPTIHFLMEKCWDMNPVIRPTANDVTHILTSPDSLLVSSIYPDIESNKKLENVTCVAPWIDVKKSVEKPILVTWCGMGENRKYEIIDIETMSKVTEIKCPGPRVLCALQVNGYLWLGTEGHQIEVFGKVLSPSASILWSITLKNHILSMLLYKTKKKNNERVFASLVNGTLIVVSKLLDDKYGHTTPLFNQERQDIIAYEKDQWSDIHELNLATQEPAKCMCLTRNNTELWVGSGSMIIIIDPESLAIVHRMQASNTKSVLSLLVSNGRYVWSSDWKNSYIRQWCVETRTKLFTFNCNVENPLGQNICHKISYRELDSVEESPHNNISQLKETSKDIEHLDNAEQDSKNESKSIDHENSLPSMNGSNESKDLKTEDSSLSASLPRASTSVTGRSPLIKRSVRKSFSNKSLLPSYVSENPVKDEVTNQVISNKGTDKNKETDKIIKNSKLMQRISSIKRQPSLMGLRRDRSKKNQALPDVKSNSPSPLRPRSHVINSMRLERVTALFYYAGLLWIGRSSGDILILEFENESQNEELIGVVKYVVGSVSSKESQFSNTITSISRIDATNEFLLTLRMDPKSERRRSISVPRKMSKDESIDEHFRLVIVEPWSRTDFLKFHRDVGNG